MSIETIPEPVKVKHHLSDAVKLNPKQLRQDIASVEGFNAKVAVLITGGVGTMACAYIFAAIALISLPAAINSGQVIIIVAWTAQTFLQLVLLSIIMVGQDVQSKAADARSEKTYQDTELLLDRLDIHTAGGLKDLHDSLVARLDALGQPSPKPAPPRRPRSR